MLTKLFENSLKYKAMLLLLPVLSGILIESTHHWLGRLLILCGTVIWIWHINRRSFMHGIPLVRSILFFICAAGLSYTNSHLQKIQNNKAYYGNIVDENASFILKIITPAQKTKTQNKYIASVLKTQKTSWENSLGKVYLFVPDSLKILEEGDIIYTSAPHSLIPPSKNPYEFDFKSFALNQQITGTIFTSNVGFHMLKKGKVGILQKFKIKVRNYITNMGHKYINAESYPLFKALTLGDKSGLDDEVKANFAKTGVLHLIALSGFHVLIVWLFIYWPLVFIRKPRVREVTALLLLWIYAYLMGMTPSILRAVAVITIWKAAPYFGRRRESVNTLFYIAAILLLFKPAWIKDVGFQLSFLATMSIIFFYAPIYNTLRTTYSILNKPISILSVSIAAQILSFPISIYYFHQFPITFLISNLIGSVVVMVLVPLNFVFLCIAAVFPSLAIILGNTIHFFTHQFYLFVEGVSNLQVPWFSRLHIDGWEVLMIFFLIITTVYLIQTRQWKYYKMAMFSMLMLGSYALYSKYDMHARPKIILHHLSQGTVIQYMDKSMARLYTSPEVTDFDWTNKVMPIQRAHYISEASIKTDTLTSDVNYTLNVANKRILILGKSTTYQDSESMDYIFLRHSVKTNLEDLYNRYMPQMIIADGSNKRYQIKAWKENAENSNIPFYATADSTAFILELR